MQDLKGIGRPTLAQERIRLLELLVSSQCPEQGSVLGQPSLDRIVPYLRACFQVGLSSIRNHRSSAWLCATVKLSTGVGG